MAITTKLSVTGLSSYKKAISEATSSVREYDSELKLVEETYKSSGSKADYMRAKAQVLARKLEAQTTIVQQTEAALKASAAAYGDNSAQAQQWRTRLNNARTSLTKTKNELAATSAKMDALKTGTDAAGTEMTELGTAAGKTGGALESINGKLDTAVLAQGIEGVTRALAGAARRAASLATNVWRITADAGSWADDLKTTATQAGIDTTTLQQWQYAARFVDTSADTIISARRRILSGINSGGVEVGGVSIATADSAGALRSWEDIFWDSIAALQAIDNETARDAAAMELFGKNYAEMIPLIEAGREAWEAYAAQAPTLTESQVDALGSVDDAMNSMGAGLSSAKLQLLSAIAPVIQSVAEALGGLAQQMGAYLQTEEGQQLLDNLAESMRGLTGTLFKPETIQAVFDGITGALRGLTDALDWIVKNQDGVKTAIGVIATALGGLKVSEGVLKFMQLAQSTKNLLGGKGAETAGKTAAKTVPKAVKAATMPWLKSAALTVGVPAGVLAAAIAPAAIAQQHDVAAQDAERRQLAERTEQAAEAIGEEAGALQQAMAVALGGYEGGSDIFGQRTLAGPAEVSRALTGLKQFEWLETLLSPETWAQLQAIGTDASTLDAWQETELLETITNTMAEHMEALAAQAAADGENTAVGLGNGIYAKSAYALQAAEDLANGVRDRMQSTLDIQSPSRVMEALGGYTGEGFALGIEGSLQRVRAATEGLAAAATTGAATHPRAAWTAAAGQPLMTAEDIGSAMRSAMAGIAVLMNGERVGAIVSDTVDDEIGRAAYSNRYST